MCNTQVCGLDIPKDTDVFFNLWGQHHSELIWGDPFIFRPERFLDNDGELLLPDHPLRKALLVFGAGTRGCVGENLALTRIFLLIANLIQRFHVLPSGSCEDQPSCHPTNMIFGSIMLPKPYMVRFKERN